MDLIIEANGNFKTVKQKIWSPTNPTKTEIYDLSRRHLDSAGKWKGKRCQNDICHAFGHIPSF